MSGSHQRSSSTWHCVSPLLGDSRAGVPYQAASRRSQVDDDHLIRDDRRSCKRTPPDCHRMVIRLRYGVKGGCDRRTTSTGETCWVNGHANPPLTPPLQRIGRQQSVRWGRSAALQDHGRAEPGLRTTDPCPRDAPEPPSTANDHHLQQPANMKLGRAFNPRAAHENTLVMRRSSVRFR